MTIPKRGDYVLNRLTRPSLQRTLKQIDADEFARHRSLGEVGHRERREATADDLERASRTLASRCQWLDEFASADLHIRNRLEIAAKDLWSLAQQLRKAEK